MDPVAVLASIQSGISITKAMVSGLKAIKETDKALATVELQEQVIDVREQLVNAKDLITTLLQENQELRSQIQIARELEHDENGNVLWRIEEGRRRGPYCSTCYGAENKIISLSGDDDSSWYCPKCKNHYHTKEWSAEQMRKHQALSQSYSRGPFL